METIIFLGGTCGKSEWRKAFTEDLVSMGVDESGIFNPVVLDWTPECAAAEDAAKSQAKWNVFYLCDPKEEGNPVSVYSMVEAVTALYDRPKNTIVVFDNQGYTGHALKALVKSESDLRHRFPKGHIYSSRDDALEFLSSKDIPDWSLTSAKQDEMWRLGDV